MKNPQYESFQFVIKSVIQTLAVKETMEFEVGDNRSCGNPLLARIKSKCKIYKVKLFLIMLFSAAMGFSNCSTMPSYYDDEGGICSIPCKELEKKDIYFKRPGYPDYYFRQLPLKRYGSYIPVPRRNKDKYNEY